MKSLPEHRAGRSSYQNLFAQRSRYLSRTLQILSLAVLLTILLVFISPVSPSQTDDTSIKKASIGPDPRAFKEEAIQILKENPLIGMISNPEGANADLHQMAIMIYLFSFEGCIRTESIRTTLLLSLRKGVFPARSIFHDLRADFMEEHSGAHI